MLQVNYLQHHHRLKLTLLFIKSSYHTFNSTKELKLSIDSCHINSQSNPGSCSGAGKQHHQCWMYLISHVFTDSNWLNPKSSLSNTVECSVISDIFTGWKPLLFIKSPYDTLAIRFILKLSMNPMSCSISNMINVVGK